jgi:hypothetical protein
MDSPSPKSVPYREFLSIGIPLNAAFHVRKHQNIGHAIGHIFGEGAKFRLYVFEEYIRFTYDSTSQVCLFQYRYTPLI